MLSKDHLGLERENSRWAGCQGFLRMLPEGAGLRLSPGSLSSQVGGTTHNLISKITRQFERRWWCVIEAPSTISFAYFLTKKEDVIALEETA